MEIAETRLDLKGLVSRGSGEGEKDTSTLLQMTMLASATRRRKRNSQRCTVLIR